MIWNSIRLRLLLAAGLMIILALLASGASIVLIFQRHLEQRVQSELEKHSTQLLAAIDVQADGKIVLSQQLADPRFTLPLSGLYWQIDYAGKPVARSRSLGDQKLLVSTPPADDFDAHMHEIKGPDAQNLYALEQNVFLGSQGQDLLYVATIGLERGEINDTVLSMTRDVVPALGLLGLLLLLATWVQVSLGLQPLSMIEKALQGIREGGKGRVDQEVAVEVKPLVTELNALLAANEERNRVERQRAADLAHGLRTPLTILRSISRTVADAGLKGEAEKISIQTEHMRQQVERELSRALSSAEDVAVWLDVHANVSRLIKVVAMAAPHPEFKWDIDIPENSQCRITRNDFNEILGNILENAQKWGRLQARVRLRENQLLIGDDGPGVKSHHFDKLTERGFTTGGETASTGLGLAIVQQLAEKNMTELSFGTSELGGFSVQLTFPRERMRARPQVAGAQA
jgi:signal transduction histidine kinase